MVNQSDQDVCFSEKMSLHWVKNKNSVKLTKRLFFYLPHEKVERSESPCKFKKMFVYHVENENSELQHEIF